MLNKNTAGFHPQSWSEAVHHLGNIGANYVLVTILGTTGSTPRANGTKMVVTDEDIYDTVGGGHLEYKIIEKSRALLAGETLDSETLDSKPQLDKSSVDDTVHNDRAKVAKPGQHIEHFPLGAKLGQCCGGSVAVLLETIVTERQVIQVHGAGHVGHALIQILSQLPLTIQWVDSREELFPESLPANVQCLPEAYPEDAVKAAPANSQYVILTHNHQLDFTLTEKIISRGDAAFLGVIGSDTKAKRFRMRLEHKRYSEAQIEQMTCPVGLPQVAGKLPMEVAVSIAGQIIAQYQAAQCQASTEKSKRAGLSWRELQTEISQTGEPVYEKDSV